MLLRKHQVEAVDAICAAAKGGPTVFELGMAEAIERGILADYQVVMPIVHEADLHPLLATHLPGTSAHHEGLRNAAVQVSVLRAIAQYALRRVLAFHNRVALAEGFAQSLPTTAREMGAPLRIDDLWARAIHGKQPADYRRDLLADFALSERPCAVLSNVRVLNEGVDIIWSHSECELRLLWSCDAEMLRLLGVSKRE